MRQKLMMLTFALAYLGEGAIAEACYGPEPPEHCKCYGLRHPICIVSLPPPSCTPCLYGCNGSGECLDEPYSEDGLPLVTSEYDSCTLLEYEGTGLFGGSCDDDAYTWICDEVRCIDSFETYFPSR